MLIQLLVRYTRLNGSIEIAGVDLYDLVHP